MDGLFFSMAKRPAEEGGDGLKSFDFDKEDGCCRDHDAESEAEPSAQEFLEQSVSRQWPNVSKSNNTMRIMVLGLRGFPGLEGGVERHAEHLYPLLVKLGYDIEVIVRSPYWTRERDRVWQGVRFRPLWSPRRSGLEVLIHSFIGVIYAAFTRPDILHIQAIGPAIATSRMRNVYLDNCS